MTTKADFSPELQAAQQFLELQPASPEEWHARQKLIVEAVAARGYCVPTQDKPNTSVALTMISRVEFPDIPEVRRMIVTIFQAAAQFNLDTAATRKLYPWLVN